MSFVSLELSSKHLHNGDLVEEEEEEEEGKGKGESTVVVNVEEDERRRRGRRRRTRCEKFRREGLAQASSFDDNEFEEQKDDERKKTKHDRHGGGELGEGYVLRAKDGFEMFTVQKHLGTGSYGSVFRAVRMMSRWERDARVKTIHRRRWKKEKHRRDDEASSSAAEEEEHKQVSTSSVSSSSNNNNPTLLPIRPQWPVHRRNAEGQEDETLSDVYAMKVLLNPTPAHLAELCREARVLLHISRHRNIAALRFVYPRGAKNELLIFTDCVRGTGKNLQADIDAGTVFRKSGSISEADVVMKLLDICLQFAAGLAHLHSTCEILHLDVKNENACIDSNGTLKIIDFGLSQRGVFRHMVRTNKTKTQTTQGGGGISSSIRKWELALKRQTLWQWVGCAVVVFFLVTAEAASNYSAAAFAISFVWRVSWEFGLARYPVLRRRRTDARVLHAEFSGGTRSYMSPEAVEAFKAKCKSSKKILLSAAETDCWAFAVCVVRLFQPDPRVYRGCCGAVVGDNFREHVGEREPKQSKHAWHTRLQSWEPAEVVQWLRNDLAETLRGAGPPESLVKLIENTPDAGLRLSRVLAAGDEDGEDAFEREFLRSRDGGIPQIQTPASFTAYLRRARLCLSGGTKYPLPNGLRALLSRCLAEDKFTRPALMQVVVVELMAIGAAAAHGAHRGSRARDRLRLTVGACNETREESVNDRTVHIAQRVGALVNVANALSAPSSSSAKLLDERIDLLTEALEVQRDAQIDGIDDNTGGLRGALAQACFRRYRRSLLLTLFLFLVYPGGLCEMIHGVWSRMQFRDPSPQGFANVLSSWQSCGRVFPEMGLCDDDAACGDDWFCAEGNSHGKGTFRACIPCTRFCLLEPSVEQQIACLTRHNSSSTCSAIANLFIEGSSLRCRVVYWTASVLWVGITLFFYALTVIFASSVFLVFNLLTPGGGGRERPSIVALVRRSRVAAWGIGLWAPFVVGPSRWSSASSNFHFKSRTGGEIWWWRTRRKTEKSPWYTLAGLRNRLRGKHLPTWELETYWRNWLTAIFLGLCLCLWVGIGLIGAAVAWETPVLVRKFRATPASLVAILIMTVVSTVYLFIPAVCLLHGRKYEYFCSNNGLGDTSCDAFGLPLYDIAALTFLRRLRWW